MLAQLSSAEVIQSDTDFVLHCSESKKDGFLRHNYLHDSFIQVESRFYKNPNWPILTVFLYISHPQLGIYIYIYLHRYTYTGKLRLHKQSS